MILAAGALLIFATVPLLGGRLGQVGAVRFRRTGWLIAALLVQVGVLQVLPSRLPTFGAAALHVASYAAAAVFVWSNRAIPGLWLIGVGGMSNLVAISMNGGVMPASAAARAAAGLSASSEFENSAVVAAPRLAFLGDVFAWPAPLPFANVFSVGDVLLLAGAAILVHRVGGSRLAVRRVRVPARP